MRPGKSLLDFGIGLLLLGSPLFFLPFIAADPFFKPKLGFILIVGGGLLLVWAFYAKRWQVLPVRTGLEWPLAALMASMFVSVLCAPDPGPSLFQFLQVLTHIGLFYLFAAYWRDRLASGRGSGILTLCFVAGGITSLYTLLQSYGIDIGPFEGGVPDWRGRLNGTLGGPNFVAGYLAMSLPIGLWLCREFLDFCTPHPPFLVGLPVGLWYCGRERRIRRLLAGLGLVLVLSALLVTWSFGAWTGIWAALLILLGLKEFRVRVLRHESGVVAVIFIAVCAFYLLPNPVNGVGRSLFQEAFASPRWRTGGAARAWIWKTTALMVRDRPLLGIGFGNYYRVQQVYQGELYRLRDLYHDRRLVSNVPQVHNEYYQQLAETGVPGAVAMFWLIAVAIRMLYRRLKGARGDQAGALLAASAGMIVAMVHALQSYPFRIPPNALLFLFFAGRIYGPDAKEAFTERSSHPRLVRGAIYCAISIAGIVGLLAGEMILVSQILLGPPGPYPERRVVQIQASVHVNPYSIEARDRLVNALINLEDFETGLAESEKALRLRESMTVRMQRRYILLRMGRIREAVLEGRKVVAVNPCYAPVLVVQASIERAAGNDREAQELEDRASRFLHQIIEDGNAEEFARQVEEVRRANPSVAERVTQWASGDSK